MFAFSLSDVSTIVNRVVSSSSAGAALTATSSAQPQKYRMLSPQRTTSQKVLISSGTDSGAVLKTHDGKIINLRNLTTSQGLTTQKTGQG